MPRFLPSPIALSLVAVGLALAISAEAATIHVPGDSATIQAGINGAVVGDTVLVACSTYHEYDIVMKSGVCLRSETGQPDCVTIDADSLGRIIICDHVDNTASIEGFTITGGFVTDIFGGGIYCYFSSPTIAGCVIMGNTVAGDADGGGIECDHSSPTITACTISGNSASTFGGGIDCFHSSPTITGCTISGNSSGSGGGIECYTSSPTITACTISGNSGGGIECFISSFPTITGCIILGNSGGLGGGICCLSSSPTITDCTISGNSGGSGGGIYCDVFISGPSSPTITNCTISGNSASPYHGGGIYCHLNSSPAITGCTISGNSADYGGGGICCHDLSFPTIDSCTISGNSAGVCGGGMFCWDNSSPTLENTIIAFSTQGEAVYCYDPASNPVLTCCDVYGNAGGDWVGCIADQHGINGNFSEDPLFCDPDNDDYNLHEDSPCAPDNSPPECGLIGAWPVGCNRFVRGDAVADGNHDIFDGLRILYWLGGAADPPPCNNAADADDNEGVDVFDALRIFYWLGGETDPLPAPCCDIPADCGEDPTPGPLPCDSYSPCGTTGVAMSKIASFGSAEESRLVVERAVTMDKTVIVPVAVINHEPLVGFSWTVEYDPKLLTAKAVDNTGLATEGFNLFVGGVREPGSVKVVAVRDLKVGDGVDRLPAGEHQVATIIFEVNKNASVQDAILKVTGSEMAISHDRALSHRTVDGVVKFAAELPGEFSLSQNYPNPFNPVTVIPYHLPAQPSAIGDRRSVPITLKVYNIAGQVVRRLVDGSQSPGHHRVVWDGRNDRGQEVVSGLYFYRLRAGDFTETRQMLLLK